MLSEFKSSLFSVVNERINSPLAGAFAFSWFACNWRIPYSLFFANESMTLDQRLTYIDQHFLSWERNLGYPALFTLFVLILYPILSTGALWIWMRTKAKQVEMKIKIDKITPLSPEEALNVRMLDLRQRQEFNEIMRSKEEAIVGLNARLDAATRELDDVSIARKALTDTISQGDERSAQQASQIELLRTERLGLQQRIAELNAAVTSLEQLTAAPAADAGMSLNQGIEFQRLTQSVEQRKDLSAIKNWIDQGATTSYLDNLPYTHKLVGAGLLKPLAGNYRWTIKGREFLEFCRKSFGLN